MGEIGSASEHKVAIARDDEWVNSVIKRIQGSRHQTKWGAGEATIYRVCPEVRSGDPEAYEPSIVSIGPYHRGKNRLKVMEELKWQYVDHHIMNCRDGSIPKYLTKMKEMEAETRRYYSEEINLESSDFVEMMLLDGCFLVQILLDMRAGRPGQQLRETLWFDFLLINDLLKLENQLPFFIVQFFHDELHSQRQLKVDALNFMERVLSKDTKYGKLDIDLRDLHAHHFLHLFHEYFFSFKAPENNNMQIASCCKPVRDRVEKIKNQLRHKMENWLKREQQNFDKPLPSRTIDSSACCSNPVYHIKKIKNRFLLLLDGLFFPRERLMKRIPCAVELKEAGVKLKSSNKEIFFDISFNNGVLEIPPFHVDDSTNCIFRNLIALEQCGPRFGNVVTCYIFFMDSLINTQSDVELLQHVGIIENDIGLSTVLASLFNNIGKNITYDPSNYYLAEVIKGVNKYCESKTHKWRAKLMREYFSNPWAIISFIAALVLLVLTILQTVYTILG